ncbi:hypothetical protein BJ138DRAFT_1159484 [Hygrophoropsis aurantiaca]|uniref:Uncharacterized protein n=1 Tax=Hygrophoropsis aurantiaca TaxID=72124 RepID=A0ACB8A392_9AGAM|nr:hypothetical protein BJ138DRAFT_1159484 [Hygrophoropsis aurantiaca]
MLMLMLVLILGARTKVGTQNKSSTSTSADGPEDAQTRFKHAHWQIGRDELSQFVSVPTQRFQGTSDPVWIAIPQVR